MSLVDEISSDLNARGLVIIITNDYSGPQPKLPRDHPPLEELPGTKIDGKNLSEAFLELQFTVHWEHNITLEKFTKLIYQATSYTGYTKFKRYKCIVFVFSGHGDEGDLVYLQDGSQVSIGDHIITPFLPKESRDMGKFQKVFLFDACRGKQHTQTVEVPKGQSPKGKVDESRGGTVIDKIRIPDRGGFLVAYSTMPSHQAWERKGVGGAWLQRVAKRIREDRFSSVEDVLTAVNKDLIDAGPRNAQQPEKLSRLNDFVYLHPDKDNHSPDQSQKKRNIAIAAVFPPSTDSQHQVAGNQAEDKNVHLKKLTSQYPGVAFQDYVYKPPEYGNVSYYRSIVTVSGLGMEKVVGDSKQYFVSIDHSRDEAAREVLTKIAKLIPAQHSTPHPNFACGIGSLPAVASMDHHCTAPQVPKVPAIEATARSTPTPTCKERMQTFFQRNKINPQFEYQSDNTTTDRARYRCIVRYTINGKQRKIDSGHYYYSKAEAKDQVAKLVLARENVTQESISRGNAPPSKVWKSQLKEYCDKKEQLNPAYVTVQSGTGFVSTVTCCGSVFQGQVCGSKQEAEHSAAWSALQRLQ